MASEISAPESDAGGANAPERIRRRLEQEIESGALAPGVALDEKQIAERFGVSRTPVREALLMLTTQKLVAVVPRSGMYVYRPDAAELISLLELLGELEAVAARLAAQRMNAEQRMALARLHEDMGRLASAQDKPAYEAANLALHRAVQQGCGNPSVREEIDAVRRRLASFRRHVFEQPGRLRSSHGEHEPLVLALVAGDAENAARAMREHIIGKGKAYADLVLANT
ncbi:GntR family transcriptional regulator [Orrella sp. JC864]|uniref:GntR family transcriptional regulator n=1 Tax=Orrella sp. JC864 TaxID=3120298 RepID=UPI0030087746